MCGARRLASLASLLAFLAGARDAHATYSIVAADTATREVGGAGTSCLSGQDVYIIYGSVPGVGAVHTQALYSRAAHDRSVELVAAGLLPAEVIAALTDEAFDSDAQSRQFGVVDVEGRSAGFTGARDGAYAGDRQGALGTFHYSVQGNILTSEAVLSQAAQGFEASGCDLAERLLRALESGGDNGEGDRRCTVSRGIPSDSAFVQVDRPNEPAGRYLELHVPTSDENPLPELRARFDTWRETHPCPSAGEGTGRDPAATPAPERRATGANGCGCRAAGDPRGGSPFVWAAFGALLLGRLRRWNPRRFQC
jgi:MYXO-CTERM domain-containing protein